MATPGGNLIALSGNPLIDGLLSQHSWMLGVDRVITYSLHSLVGGRSWRNDEIAAVDRAFAAWEAVANVDFQRLGAPDSQALEVSTADIAIGLAEDLPDALAFAIYPTTTTTSERALSVLSEAYGIPASTIDYQRPSGDIFIDSVSSKWTDSVSSGSYGLRLLLHEIGHSLGLKHPHGGDRGGGSFIELGIGRLDSNYYTVMSYELIPGSTNSLGNPTTPMLLDILAIQEIYGPNLSHHSGNNIYDLQVGGVAQTIWDAGGHDTFSATHVGSPVVLDIAEAGRSETGSAITFIAYNAIIEDAIGSSFDDLIMGNSFANRLVGGAGQDEIRGRGGSDVLIGGSGADELVGGGGADRLLGGVGDDIYVIDNGSEINTGQSDPGMDSVRSVVEYKLGNQQENLALLGNGAVNGTGNAGDNSLHGNAGSNRLVGGAGNDRLDGRGGRDTLIGGNGDDIYVLDTGSEIPASVDDPGIDTVRVSISYTLGPNQENLTLLAGSATSATGNGLQNRIVGNDSANRLDGRGGNDILLGSGGADHLYFDASDKTMVDGGDGKDSLIIRGFGTVADLVDLNDGELVHRNIEILDMTSSGSQQVLLSQSVVRGLSDSTNLLRIDGGTADVVEVSGLWARLDDVAIGSSTYRQYGSGGIVLQLDSDIGNVSILEVIDKLELSGLTGVDGIRISGAIAGDYSGRSVANAGDVNGDGFDDTLIGAYRADASGPDSGMTYVVFGGPESVDSNLSLSDLNGSNGFRLDGVNEFDKSGFAVSSAGDLNGDGFTDVMAGAYSAVVNGSRSGAAYVVFGASTGFAPDMELSALNGSDGFRMNGANDSTGSSVSDAGDVNGDGVNDILVGALQADTPDNFSGAVYVVYGRHSGFASDIELSQLDGTSGFRINAEVAGGQLGSSVSSAGDVNADGLEDIVIAARYAGVNGTQSGASYVVFGSESEFASRIELSTLNGSNGFRIWGESSADVAGCSVSAAGDINGDGFGDFVIGAYQARGDGISKGAGYVVFGSDSAFPAVLELSSLNGHNGFQISGESRGDEAGYSVSGAGDVNADGFADLIIGARFAEFGGSQSGAAYVVFGNAHGFGSNLDLSALFGSRGFMISGISAGDRLGSSVSSAGDVNGDGFDDLLVGAPGSDYGDADSGSTYLIYGRDFTHEVDRVGTNGADQLAGTDSANGIVGGRGDDLVRAGSGSDVINGGSGSDIIYGESGVDRIEGGAGADVLNGGGGKDRLFGDDGADVLSGGPGNDTLSGGAGNDVFLFSDAFTSSNVDTIMDFAGAGTLELDVIHLELDTFAALITTGNLDAANFASNPTGAAGDADDFILYNTMTGELFYDADGSGTDHAALPFAVIASDIDTLSAVDFVVL